jgi:hypothetical protein
MVSIYYCAAEVELQTLTLGRGGAVVVRVPSHCEGRVFDPGFRSVPPPLTVGEGALRT